MWDSIHEQIRDYEQDVLDDAELVELIKHEDEDIRENQLENQLEQEILNEA